MHNSLKKLLIRKRNEKLAPFDFGVIYVRIITKHFLYWLKINNKIASFCPFDFGVTYDMSQFSWKKHFFIHNYLQKLLIKNKFILFWCHDHILCMFIKKNVTDYK